MTSDEDPLVRRIQSGDAEALAEFLRARSRQLLAFIERQLSPSLRRKVDAQDVLQEVGLHALKALPTADLGQRDPFGWLCLLAQQRVIDAHRTFVTAQKRSAGREVSLHAPAGGQSGAAALADVLAASITSPSSAFSREQRQTRLLQALEGLPPTAREVLRLRYAEGLPTKAIAQRLGKSDGAVRVLLARCVSRLQQLLGADAPPGEPPPDP